MTHTSGRIRGGSAAMMERFEDVSPKFKARLAGIFYLLTFVTGIFAFLSTSGRFVNNLVADACYIAVTLLFYDIFKPVNRTLSFVAALVSLLGCVDGVLRLFHLAPVPVNPLVFFGFYCLLLGYLIFRSTFLPRILGAFIAFAGLGWLTFLSQSFGDSLSPYNMAPGFIGEGTLCLWLLIVGLNVQRWNEQAARAAGTDRK